MEIFDIAVIGGGASGLTAAIHAKRAAPKLRVAILERLPRVGKKLLACGNGRCNYTNINVSKEKYHGSCAELVGSIGGFDVRDFFVSLGVYGFSDSEGRVYPLSENAGSVLDGLRLEADKLGVETICECPVDRINVGKVFRIFSGERDFSAKRVILAGGGMSQSALGSDGSALRLAKKLGLQCAPLRPALTPLKTTPELVRPLKGLRANALVTLFCGEKAVGSEAGEVQFGDGTLSGICVMNLSHFYRDNENFSLSLDLLPEKKESEILSILREMKKIRAKAPLEDFLSGLFHKRVGIYLLKKCTSHALTEPSEVLSEKELENAARLIKSLRFPVIGAAGFEKSQVTAGGILLSELTAQLECRKISGLFCCGELLDIAGDCGGYNLTFAFASGAAAGKNAAEGL